MQAFGVAAVAFIIWAMLASCISNQSGIATCQTGWFGSECQFKCRCAFNQCNESGQCTGFFSCLPKWFGPACQYRNLVFGRGLLPILTDQNDETCLNGTSISQVRIPFEARFSWLRVHTRTPGVARSLNFRLNMRQAYVRCQMPLRVTIDDQTLDFHCAVSGHVTEVVILGSAVSFLCSVYVSGGRNLALRQNATQSSTYFENSTLTNYRNVTFSADLAVDGNTDARFFIGFTCMHTKVRTPEYSYWILRLSPPGIVNCYILFNRADNVITRIAGFILQSYGVNGSEVFFHQDTEPIPLMAYTINHDAMEIAEVKITSTFFTHVLNFCELEVYGEMVCDVGKYGLECDKTCNCFIQEDCLPADGFCTTGCASGYVGYDCGTPCSPGMYGLKCQDSCSQHCLRDSTNNTSCDHETGYCLNGCEIGYQKPNCDRHCPASSFGQLCDSQCSPACRHPTNVTVESLCDLLNGTCLYGCDPGYRGSTCSASCEPNRYGINCQQSCSRGCVDVSNSSLSSCDYINGSCILGCRSGYKGTLCARA